MEPIHFMYFVYGSGTDLKPLDTGTAFYARAWVSEHDCRDFRWDQIACSWEPTTYLLRLSSRGDPDLDNVHPRDIPDWIPAPIID